MKTFMGKNFLLKTDTAKQLYHEIAEKLPIIDYHCHVSPREIAENKQYRNITELWLGGDHYKWRAMRSCGIPEKYITGDASDYEKFRSFACAMPRLIGNPMYHWSHLELKRYFGYDGILNADTCDEVWELCNEILQSPDMSVRRIIEKSGVEVICTTDDPCDTLEWHEMIAEDEDFNVKVLPAWRPDKGLNMEKPDWKEYIAKLSKASGIEINSYSSLLDAYRVRLDYFSAHGCINADHGLDEQIPYALPERPASPSEIFDRAMNGDFIYTDEIAVFKTALLRFFAGEYTRRGWVMQLHFGVLRNVNTPMFNQLGPDMGFDVIGGRVSITELAKLLNTFAQDRGLPKTIVYSVNPSDNAAIGALIGAFQNDADPQGKPEGGMPRIMQGSAWWFNDNKLGMREQITTLANLSALGSFIGMLTDSRSFISYTRHEYFRRILCDIIGDWVESGEYPADADTLSELVADICYNNTKRFFAL